MDKLILNCSQCGGRLEITQEIEIFRCRFCGTPYLVERKAGTVEVKRLEARVTALESGQADIKASLAAEEEIKTLLARRQELKQLREQPRAPDYSEQLRWNATGGLFSATSTVLWHDRRLFCSGHSLGRISKTGDYRLLRGTGGGHRSAHVSGLPLARHQPRIKSYSAGHSGD